MLTVPRRQTEEPTAQTHGASHPPPARCVPSAPQPSRAALKHPLTPSLAACSQVCNCFCSNLSTSNTATSSLCSLVPKCFPI